MPRDTAEFCRLMAANERLWKNDKWADLLLSQDFIANAVNNAKSDDKFHYDSLCYAAQVLGMECALYHTLDLLSFTRYNEEYTVMVVPLGLFCLLVVKVVEQTIKLCTCNYSIVLKAGCKDAANYYYRLNGERCELCKQCL